MVNARFFFGGEGTARNPECSAAYYILALLTPFRHFISNRHIRPKHSLNEVASGHRNGRDYRLKKND